MPSARSFSDLSNLFGPDASAQDTKNRASAEAARGEVEAMENIAQRALKPKVVDFGLADPNKVTDIAEAQLERGLNVQQQAEQRAGYRLLGQSTMSLAEWASIEPNPRQRDTALHARKAKHLREYDPLHRFVTMAVLPNGRRLKVDGHTRSYVWQNAMAVGPDSVTVSIYHCENEAAAEALYSKFDSSSAVETGADKIAGAARRCGLEFQTGFLKAGRYGSAVKRLYAYTTKTWGQPWQSHDFVYSAVDFYAAELKLLDSVTPTPALFPSGIVMAALATFKRRGKIALPFWQAYAAEQGVKTGPKMDGVQALLETVSKHKAEAAGRGAEGGGSQQIVLLGKGILAFEEFRSGGMYKVGKWGGVRAMSDQTLVEYLRKSRGA